MREINTRETSEEKKSINVRKRFDNSINDVPH